MKSKLFGMLGLAAKVGKVVSGEFSVEKAIKERSAHLVILAEDASDNTKKHFSDMCSYRNIPILFFGTKEELGNCIGKSFRANLALTDQGFAKSIIKKHEQEQSLGGKEV